jgi:hypothetical protein
MFSWTDETPRNFPQKPNHLRNQEERTLKLFAESHIIQESLQAKLNFNAKNKPHARNNSHAQSISSTSYPLFSLHFQRHRKDGKNEFPV